MTAKFLQPKTADTTPDMSKADAKREAERRWGSTAYLSTRKGQWGNPPDFIVRPDKDEVGGVGPSWREAFADFDRRYPDFQWDRPVATDGEQVHRITKLPADFADAIVAHIRRPEPVPSSDYRVQRTEGGQAYLVIPVKPNEYQINALKHFVSGFEFALTLK
jgi:hypothetical protein